MNEPQEKNCQNCHGSFTIAPEDFDFYKKIDVPPPTWCPECRKIRRMMFRNERSLYHGNCTLCKKRMLSSYAPDSPYVVYCKECWFSDAWDALSYGQEYDFNRPFFEQFWELKKQVPRVATMLVRNNLNVDYANFLADAKNVYLAYSIVRSEDIMYSRVVDDSRNCIDCNDVGDGELVYEAVQSDNLNRIRFAFSCSDCMSSSFLYDCVGCQDCFMSANLRSKRYVFRNKQLTKDEYRAQIAAINFGSYAALNAFYSEYRDMIRISLHKYGDIVRSVHCTGNNIVDSKNVHLSFDIDNSEDCKYCDRLIGPKDSYDIYGGASGTLGYEGMAVTYGGYNTKFVLIGDDMRNSYYTDYSLHSSDLFGCIGIKKKSYCILNRQYSKEKYGELVPKIIKHMNEMPYTDEGGRVYRYGEFFPPYQYAYNETLAQEHFPLTKDEVLARGYRWRDAEKKDHHSTISFDALPDDIRDVKDNIIKEVLECNHRSACNEKCTGAFKITGAELQFYRQMNIPLPRLCPNCRYYGRLKIRNPLKLWHRKCRCAGVESEESLWKNTASHFHGIDHCPNEFETSYAPERRETVYCEQCYNAEIA